MMTEGPLSAACVRTLTDKLYEKRKAAALEIEKLIRDQVSAGQMSQVDKIAGVLSDLCISNNPHNRKGGLIGLAAAAIALGKLTSDYTPQLILPVLSCFDDTDSRVRYYACESLYNIIKVARESSLLHFEALFDSLSRLCADTDQNVRNGNELLDRLLKDIVTSYHEFKVEEFMLLIRERIHTKNSSVRRFLVSWLSTLYTVPEIKLLPFLPEILDGLLQTLSDPNHMVREICEALLGQFLQSIKQNPGQLQLQDMVNVLIVHAQAPDNLVCYISLVWMKDFIIIAEPLVLPYTSGYLTAILPCMAYTDESKRGIHDVSKVIHHSLMQIVTEQNDNVKKYLDMRSLVGVLQSHLRHDAVQTRVASLKWILHLHAKLPSQVFPYMEQFFPLLLTTLSDTSDEVVLLDLEVLSQVCQQRSDETPSVTDSLSNRLSPEAREALADQSAYFVKFILSLLDMFKTEPSLLSERGSFIIRQLCLLLNPEEIFRSISVVLCSEEETDVMFISQAVQTLNGILFTSSELFQLRNRLKDLDSKQSKDLFVCLYRCWCHQPVALIALCLLSQNYFHAAQLIHLFTEFDMTVDLMVEMDKLVQLLESPIFAYLRIHLLDPVHQANLATVLYGLLMLLPQTEAFQTLNKRLGCLPLISQTTIAPETKISFMPKLETKKLGMGLKGDKKQNPSLNAQEEPIPFDLLLQRFHKVQEAHKKFRRAKHKELLAKSL